MMRNRFSSLAGLAGLLAASLTASAKEPVVIPRPHPIPPIRPPVIHPVDLRANEKPIAVEKSEAVVAGLLPYSVWLLRGMPISSA